jgi:hypothetical protein
MSARPRLLAVVSRFKWIHIDYLAALAEQFELLAVWSDEGHKGAVDKALQEGMRGYPIGALRDVGAAEVRTRLKDAISAWQPQVVHVMYYDHEDLVVLVRELVGDDALLVYECRDPLTTLGVERGDPLAMNRGSDAFRIMSAGTSISSGDWCLLDSSFTRISMSSKMSRWSRTRRLPASFPTTTTTPWFRSASARRCRS